MPRYNLVGERVHDPEPDLFTVSERITVVPGKYGVSVYVRVDSAYGRAQANETFEAIRAALANFETEAHDKWEAEIADRAAQPNEQNA